MSSTWAFWGNLHLLGGGSCPATPSNRPGASSLSSTLSVPEGADLLGRRPCPVASEWVGLKGGTGRRWGAEEQGPGIFSQPPPPTNSLQMVTSVRSPWHSASLPRVQPLSLVHPWTGTGPLVPGPWYCPVLGWISRSWLHLYENVSLLTHSSIFRCVGAFYFLLWALPWSL